jgi:2-C-methyl-D-erythritol 2,4-cyclodiphosphate synthase
MDEMRIGHGYDVHRLVEGRRLVLGGVDIPHTEGLLGHSDADVLVHAIMDSIIGALGLGDIGRHFPDSSYEYKDISSLVLLGKTYEIMKKKGARIVNIDATLVMQRPKVASYIDKMRQNISEILSCSLDRVNVKATTEEKLGFTGREEGVSAHSVVLLEIKNKVPQLL